MTNPRNNTATINKIAPMIKKKGQMFPQAISGFTTQAQTKGMNRNWLEQKTEVEMILHMHIQLWKDMQRFLPPESLHNDGEVWIP